MINQDHSHLIEQSFNMGRRCYEKNLLFMLNLMPFGGLFRMREKPGTGEKR